MSFWNLYARVYDTLSNLVPYQDMLERIIELAGPLPGKKVLNVGCGTGNLEHKILLAHPDVDILGVDSSAAMLSRAHKKCGKHHFRQADLNKPLKQQGFGNGFDILIGVNVLYAVTDPVLLTRSS
jgi:ubiquinone/menaquinone biosynthesis C-methylase UbiE